MPQMIPPFPLQPHAAALGARSDASAALHCTAIASPRSDPALLCKYKSGKCANRRATKRNGQLHTLCHFHRVRQNEHQRKSDRKHRMVNVAKRAKLGSLGAILISERRHRRSSISSLSSDMTSECDSAPASPMEVGQPPLVRGYVDRHHAPCQESQQQLGSTSVQLAPPADTDTSGSGMCARSSPVHWRSHLARLASQGDVCCGNDVTGPTPMSLASPVVPAPGPPNGRLLPPISYLTQQVPGKLDAFRPVNSSTLPLPASSFLRGSSFKSSQAGEMA